jgi:hypothetical protein
MVLFRNRLFLEGIALGGTLGVIVGSVIAFQVGERGVLTARRLVQRVLVRQPHEVHFEYLLQ